MVWGQHSAPYEHSQQAHESTLCPLAAVLTVHSWWFRVHACCAQPWHTFRHAFPLAPQLATWPTSNTVMTSSKTFVECCESSDYSSVALRHRQRVVRKASRQTGLGPIDLVWVRKRCKGSFGDTTRDFFHHVIGYDVTSSASAAAYFAAMCSSQPKVSNCWLLLSRMSGLCVRPTRNYTFHVLV